MARKDPEAYREYMREYMNRRYKKHRALSIERLGGVCVGCGETDPDVLQFHHVDPSTKAFTIGDAKFQLGLERLFDEVDKCELRCADCHKQEHASKAECGTPQRYWRGCRCPLCRGAASAHNRENRRRRKERLSAVNDVC